MLAPPYDVADDQRQQLTLDDFDNVTGTTTIRETLDGTRVTFKLTGLIPNGVYTLWADFYAAPGLTDDFAHDQAFGALGSPDGSDNTFTAAEDGTITFTVVQPAGPLSWFTFVEGFEAPLYALDAPVAQFVVWGAYHIDGKSWGPYAGQDGAFDETWVGQFVTVVGPDSPVRQATAPVETSVHLEVGTFVGDEFVKPTEPGQLLFEDHTEARKPVLAPPYDIADEQRQQLTWDDFNNVSGTTTIQETLDGTRVTFELTGLIPNGVYTLWADFYAAPGLTMILPMTRPLARWVRPTGVTTPSPRLKMARSRLRPFSRLGHSHGLRLSTALRRPCMPLMHRWLSL